MNPTNSRTVSRTRCSPREGTGPAWGIRIEEARADYARVSMTVRADMLNGHGIAHGGMIFALADTRVRLCLQRRQPRERGGASARSSFSTR